MSSSGSDYIDYADILRRDVEVIFAARRDGKSMPLRVKPKRTILTAVEKTTSVDVVPKSVSASSKKREGKRHIIEAVEGILINRVRGYNVTKTVNVSNLAEDGTGVRVASISDTSKLFRLKDECYNLFPFSSNNRNTLKKAIFLYTDHLEERGDLTQEHIKCLQRSMKYIEATDEEREDYYGNEPRSVSSSSSSESIKKKAKKTRKPKKKKQSSSSESSSESRTPSTKKKRSKPTVSPNERTKSPPPRERRPPNDIKTIYAPKKTK